MNSSKSLELSVNSLAFYWSFPEIIAVDEGFYDDEELLVKVNDVTPESRVSSKNKMYEDLQKKGLADIYHAAEWVSLYRSSVSDNSRIVAWSPWKKDGVNGSFGLYTKKTSGITKPTDLQNKLIAVEEGTGSYFTTLEDLEKFLPRKKIRFRMMGDPHERLLAAIKNHVSAASLLGVYSDLAGHLELKKVFESSRKKGTLMVTTDNVITNSLKKFIKATNRAIISINKNPKKYQPKYVQRFEPILDRISKELPIGKELTKVIRIPKWSLWQKYPKVKFEDTYQWMLKQNLIKEGFSYNDLVDNRAFKDII
jgi:hypothetical protein